eukprot:scaffold13737_cov95-Isochrysis_galbana.AAC.3
MRLLPRGVGGRLSTFEGTHWLTSEDRRNGIGTLYGANANKNGYIVRTCIIQPQPERGHGSLNLNCLRLGACQAARSWLPAIVYSACARVTSPCVRLSVLLITKYLLPPKPALGPARVWSVSPPPPRARNSNSKGKG